jgi:hypothetical protein
MVTARVEARVKLRATAVCSLHTRCTHTHARGSAPKKYTLHTRGGAVRSMRLFFTYVYWEGKVSLYTYPTFLKREEGLNAPCARVSM